MNKNKYLYFLIGLIMCLCLSACSATESIHPVESESTENSISDSIQSTQPETESKGEQESMKITIKETVYEVMLDSNTTVTDIVSKLPLELRMTKYAGHEYYSELPFTPVFDENRTSEIKAGHVYYWDGWNAFVINYEDCDISPYKVVHIGEITDSTISQMLTGADDTIQIQVEN